MKWFLFVLACLGGMAETALADGDVAEGEKVYQRCLSCHSITEKVNKDKNGGPYLQGVVGRPVASVEGFAYSDAMKAFGATGAVWDETTLDTYLKGPSDLVKGNKMLAPPVRRETERADVIAYLKAHM